MYSRDKLPKQNETEKIQVIPQPVKTKKKFYIELNNGQLIELLTKMEITKAKKDNFKIVER